jgi:hypothetical protein
LRKSFIQGEVEHAVLPVDKVDIIISEWMGYFLLYEGMLDSVLAARDKWLKPDGVMLPSRSDILIAAVEDEELVNDKMDFWGNVYGFKMSVMKRTVMNDGLVDVIDPKTVISSHCTVRVGSFSSSQA